MQKRTMSDQQRRDAVALFEAGYGKRAVSARLGVSPAVVRHLRDRWRVHGSAALEERKTKQSYSFAFKLEVVKRFNAGASRVELAQEYDLSSPQLVNRWARKYREEGEAGLQPARRGRPPTTAPATELDQLQREVEYLRAEVAYLKKLEALSSRPRG